MEMRKRTERSLITKQFLKAGAHHAAVHRHAGPVFDAGDALIHKHTLAVEHFAAACLGIPDQIRSRWIRNHVSHHHVR